MVTLVRNLALNAAATASTTSTERIEVIPRRAAIHGTRGIPVSGHHQARRVRRSRGFIDVQLNRGGQ
jgi:hypothetical protein